MIERNTRMKHPQKWVGRSNVSNWFQIEVPTTPHPGCQSSPGFITLFSRESRTKPSFATGIPGGGGVEMYPLFVVVETSPGRFPIWSSAAPQGISQCWWSVRRRHPDQPEPRGWARAKFLSQQKSPKIQSTRKVRKSVCLSYTPGSTNIAGWKIHHEWRCISYQKWCFFYCYVSLPEGTIPNKDVKGYGFYKLIWSYHHVDSRSFSSSWIFR